MVRGFCAKAWEKSSVPRGTVVGIDISADLIARCNGRKTSTCLSYEVGDATKLNQPNASFDVVVCTQVAEYVADIDRVFSEAFRVLKPNGRTVFVATDWSTILWHSDNPTRMATVMKSWEAHSAHPRLPMSMANRFIKAGFHFDGAAVFPILNLKFDDDNYSKGLAQIVRNFVAGKNDISADDLKDWHDELERMSEAGRYFFSSNRYIFKASKPSSNA